MKKRNPIRPEINYYYESEELFFLPPFILTNRMNYENEKMLIQYEKYKIKKHNTVSKKKTDETQTKNFNIE